MNARGARIYIKTVLVPLQQSTISGRPRPLGIEAMDGYNAQSFGSFATLLIYIMFSAIIVSASLTANPSVSNNRLTQAFPRQTIDPICYNPPRDNCSFYSTCIESHYHCGPTGYPIGYGQAFCQKFSDERSKLDQKGVTWMLDVMQCLQRILIPEATGASGAAQTCDSLKTKALSSHAKCYVDSGFCTLGPKDWAAVLKIVGIKTLLGDKNDILQVLETGVNCIEAYAYFLTHLIP